MTRDVGATMIRTLLFAPADSPRKAERLRSSSADVSVLDIEDAVAETAKDEARRCAAQAIAADPGLPRVAVRVNGLRTPHFAADVEATAIAGLELMVVPKIESPEDLRALDELLSGYERERQIAAPIRILALLETARGIAASERIAAEVPARFERFIFGSVDYRADVGVEQTGAETELIYARSRVVNAAAIAGRGPAIDGPYLELGDDEGLRAQSRISRSMGFGGRVVIHPGQVDVVNAAYGVLDASEVQSLTAIVDGFDQALAGNVASIRVGGIFVDYPVYTRALQRLRHHRQAEALAARSSAD